MNNIRINDIEVAIIGLLKECTENANVFLGTPQSFLSQYDNELPVILVTFTGSGPYEGFYPGTLTFNFYFITLRENRLKQYDLMQMVFEKLQGLSDLSTILTNSVGASPTELNSQACLSTETIGLQLNGAFQLKSSALEYEDTEILIFNQQWICTLIN